MPDNVLYFPYIDVPRSTWLTRTLLYWGNVGVIMPLEFVESPEQLKPFTRDLLSAGLLTQVFPGHYLGSVPSLFKAFSQYLNSLDEELHIVGDGLNEYWPIPKDEGATKFTLKSWAQFRFTQKKWKV